MREEQTGGQDNHMSRFGFQFSQSFVGTGVVGGCEGVWGSLIDEDAVNIGVATGRLTPRQFRRR